MVSLCPLLLSLSYLQADPGAVEFGQQVLLGRPAAQLLEAVETAYARVGAL